MKVGDLVQHKRHNEVYVVMELSETASPMVGIWVDNQVRWILNCWIKVISEISN
jgi:hypothetical protein